MKSLLLLLATAPALAQTPSVSASPPPAHDVAWYTQRAPFAMPTVPDPVIPARTFSIRDFGALGDGKTLATAAFAKAIAACAAAGGGHVQVPAGTWLTGPIELKSNIDLHTEAGAKVVFTSDRTQYPLQAAGKGQYEVTPPIWGNKLRNVAITGAGTFDGSGEAWRPLKKGKVTASEWDRVVKSGGVLSADGKIWWPSREAMGGEALVKKLKANPNATEADYLPARDYLRPKMVVITNSQNLLLDGPTFRNSPMFVINPKGITNLIIRNVQVHNDYWAQNGDGIDISASHNVVIYHCTVSAGDDGICMKSSGNNAPDNPALTNVLIADCTVLQGHGGFVIGSNTDGGMRNIWATDCRFIGTDIGVRVKSNAGRGGLVRDIYVDNIQMSNILHEAVLFDTSYEDVPAGKEKGSGLPVAATKVPDFQQFYLKNITCKGAETAIYFQGLPEQPVHDLHFDNVTITATKGVVASDIRNIEFKNVQLTTATQPAIPAAAANDINVL
ncbi:glycoside hydrolase family 28 protein [Hymenobacter arcticus]